MSRRSGMLFLVPLLGTTAFALLTLEDLLWGQWMSAIDLMTGITVLSGPVLAACAAHLGWTQAQLDELVETTPRGYLVPLRCAVQAWGWGALGYGISVAVIVAGTLLHPHAGPLPLWVATIGLAVLGVCAFVGAFAVRVAPVRLTVIAVGPLVFLAGAFGPSPYADLLRQGPSTASLAGLTFDPRVWMLQFVALVACGGMLSSGLLVARRRFRPRDLVVPVALGALSVVALVACGSALDEPGRRRLVASDERPTVCRGSEPTICVAPSSVYAFESTDRLLRRALSQLRAIGVDVPGRYEESLVSYEPPESVGVVDVEADDARGAARSAATPAACPQWSDPREAPEKALMARELIGLWIRAREGEDVYSWTAKGDAWLKDAQAPAAEAWIRSTYAQLRSCDFAKIRLPWTPPRRG